MDAAEGDGQSAHGEHRVCGPVRTGPTSPRDVERSETPYTRIGWAHRFSLVRALVERAGDALRVLDQRDDQDRATEQQEPVAVDPEPLVERVREQRLGRDQP